eukprot:5107661-Amphidinium_carterae.1
MRAVLEHRLNASLLERRIIRPFSAQPHATQLAGAVFASASARGTMPFHSCDDWDVDCISLSSAAYLYVLQMSMKPEL